MSFEQPCPKSLNSKQKAVRTKLWFKVTMATVPDFAAVLGTVMCTAVVDKGLKGLNIYHSVLCRQRT